MARKPQTSLEPAKVPSWSIHLIAAKQHWLGYVEAEDEEAAIAEGAKQYGKPPTKLVAVRRIIGTPRRR